MQRREFIKAGAVAATAVASKRLFGWRGANNRVRMAVIGMGNRSGRVFDSFTRHEDVQFTMGCEVSESKQTGFQGPNRPLAQSLNVVGDYRRVLDRNDIDAVLIGTPDFSHAKITADALAAGKTPKTGTQEPGRHTVEPLGGPTTLQAMVKENHDYRGEW